MREGIVVDGPPVTSHEGGNKKDEGAFGLVEIGDQHIDHTEAEAGNDDDAGFEFEFLSRYSTMAPSDSSSEYGYSLVYGHHCSTGAGLPVSIQLTPT